MADLSDLLPAPAALSCLQPFNPLLCSRASRSFYVASIQFTCIGIAPLCQPQQFRSINMCHVCYWSTLTCLYISLIKIISFLQRIACLRDKPFPNWDVGPINWEEFLDSRLFSWGNNKSYILVHVHLYISASPLKRIYMRKGLGILLENCERPAATRDWTGSLWL